MGKSIRSFVVSELSFSETGLSFGWLEWRCVEFPGQIHMLSFYLSCVCGQTEGEAFERVHIFILAEGLKIEVFFCLIR